MDLFSLEVAQLEENLNFLMEDLEQVQQFETIINF